MHCCIHLKSNELLYLSTNIKEAKGLGHVNFCKSKHFLLAIYSGIEEVIINNILQYLLH